MRTTFELDAEDASHPRTMARDTVRKWRMGAAILATSLVFGCASQGSESEDPAGLDDRADTSAASSQQAQEIADGEVTAD